MLHRSPADPKGIDPVLMASCIRAVFAAAQQANVTDAGKLADIVRIVYDRARLTGDLDASLLESLFTLAR